MGGGVFIDVGELEHKPLHFDTGFVPGLIKLPDNWSQASELHTVGKAELLEGHGMRTIRVRGTITVEIHNECARCLEELEEKFDSEFDLFFHPMETIARNEEKQISNDNNDIGFYEDNGIELVDVIREQVLLWLPMRVLCREDCKGICPQCGSNRNETACECREELVDNRWDALRHMSFKN